MAKSADKAARADAKAEARELARLEKRLDKARAVETKRARKAEKASGKVARLSDELTSRRDRAGTPAPGADATDPAQAGGTTEAAGDDA